jgi:hypothetical protein
MDLHVPIRRFAAVGGILLVALLLVSFEATGQETGAPRNSQDDTAQWLPTGDGPDEEALSAGPGRAQFSFTPAGRWLRFGTRDGRALIGRGGFIVLGRDGNGAMTELLDTRTNDQRVLATSRGLEPAHEGVTGGRRYPQNGANDDGDRYVDEDRLDGRDNDGDGRIDEDFAAIGDEMVVTDYTAGPAGEPDLEIHQESYAWTLQHIDGVVITRVTVRNDRPVPIEGVRLGAVFARRPDLNVETRSFEHHNDAMATFGEPMVARGVVLTGGDDAVAVLFFSAPGEEAGASWLTGVSVGSHRLAPLVATAEEPAADAAPVGPFPRPAAGVEWVYGISPSLGTLQPGDEVSLYVAMVAPPSPDRIGRAIGHAYRTVIGDGNAHLIPPPVPVKRRMVWGLYEVDPSGGTTVTLLEPRRKGIDPMEIAFLRGFSLGRAVRSELPDGNATFQMPGDPPPAFEGHGKVVLYGRMDDGEWFDAVLNPAQGLSDAPVMSAERYFNRPGKLDEAFISGSPNPFRDATTISYEVPAHLTDDFGNDVSFAGSIETSVKVYNVAGRLVSTLVDETLSPGIYQTQWNARNQTGATVASGVYYVKLQIGNRYVTKRLIQLK